MRDEGRTYDVTAPDKKDKDREDFKGKEAAAPIQSFKQSLYTMYPELKKHSDPKASIMPARNYVY